MVFRMLVNSIKKYKFSFTYYDANEEINLFDPYNKSISNAAADSGLSQFKEKSIFTLVFSKLTLCFAFSCHGYSYTYDAMKNKKLIMSIDMVRHGDRAPNFFIPNVMDGVWEKEEIGQLTNKGIQESQKIGYKFKLYYLDKLGFLSLSPSPEEVYIRSTDFPRTKRTAKAILDGMFGDDAHNIVINFQDFKNDSCNGFAKNKEAEKRIDKILIDNMPRNFKEKLTSAVDFVNKKYQTNYSYPYGISKFGDFLHVTTIHNKSLPKGITYAQAEKFIDLTMKRYLYVWSVPARNCNHSLDLIKEVEELFKNKIHQAADVKDLKYILLTMHDTNLSPLLLFLNYPISYRPEYNSNLRFELFVDKGVFYVRTTFNEEIVKLCENELCTFNEFQENIQKSIDSKCNDFNMNYDYLMHTDIMQSD